MLRQWWGTREADSTRTNLCNILACAMQTCTWVRAYHPKCTGGACMCIGPHGYRVGMVTFAGFACRANRGYDMPLYACDNNDCAIYCATRLILLFPTIKLRHSLRWLSYHTASVWSTRLKKHPFQLFTVHAGFNRYDTIIFHKMMASSTSCKQGTDNRLQYTAVITCIYEDNNDIPYNDWTNVNQTWKFWSKSVI